MGSHKTLRSRCLVSGNTRSIRLNGRQVLNSIEKESWQTSVGKRETVFSTSRNGKYYRGSRTEDEKDQKQNDSKRAALLWMKL